MRVGQRFNPYRMFNGMFIPDPIYFYTGLSATAKLLYARLYRFKGERGDAFPAATTLAEELGLSERQVFDHLSRLVDEGFLEREPRPGTSTVYHFLWHQVFEQDEEVVRKTALPENDSDQCGKPHYPSAENRTTGSAEILTLRESIKEHEVKEEYPLPPLSENTSDEPPQPEYVALDEDDPLVRQIAYQEKRKAAAKEYRRQQRERCKQIKHDLKAHGSVRATPRVYPPRAEAPAPSPASTPALPFAAQEWNRVVTAGPAVEQWTIRDRSLDAAAGDPDFLAALPKVLALCQHAYEIQPEEVEWLNFRYLLRKSKGEAENWYRMASGEFNWLRKKRNGNGNGNSVGKDAAAKDMVERLIAKYEHREAS